MKFDKYSPALQAQNSAFWYISGQNFRPREPWLRHCAATAAAAAAAAAAGQATETLHGVLGRQ